MKFTCKKCSNELSKLELPEEQILEIWGLVSQDLRIFAVKKIIDEFKLSHRDAKIIVAHMNTDNGHCNNCNFSDLKGENANCPKCGAFNYNLNELPFSKDFCTHLEWKLDFDRLEMDDIHGFWCDGISHFPNDLKSLSKNNIIENKKIVTKAWIGKDGQDIYEMTIEFGPQAIENYVSNTSLINCIPEENSKEWIVINPKDHLIKVRLK